MKNLLLVTGIVIALTGCTDAEKANLFSYGSEGKVTCWSGGKPVFTDISTGKILQANGGGLVYRSKASGLYVKAYADCIVEQQP